MKKVLLSFMVLALMGFMVGNAMALPVSEGERIKITRAGGTGGGEFTVQNAASQFLFTSFCLELSETVNLGTLYTINTIAKGAVKGGVGGNPDPISDKTAWLYANFVSGTLASNYGYSQFDSSKGESALQHAIWGFEQEETLDSTNWFVIQANTYGWTGGYTGDVWVINLKDDAGNDRQSILVTSTPEPMTLILFGLGLIGLAGLRRKE